MSTEQLFTIIHVVATNSETQCALSELNGRNETHVEPDSHQTSKLTFHTATRHWGSQQFSVNMIKLGDWCWRTRKLGQTTAVPSRCCIALLSFSVPRPQCLGSIAFSVHQLAYPPHLLRFYFVLVRKSPVRQTHDHFLR